MTLPHEDLAADLPPPREDEPAGLRQDILDELRDHLECSIHRERCRGVVSDQQAWSRVLDRFGNPTKLAAQLYFQRMWRRVMKERIYLVTIGVITLLLLATIGMLWTVMDRQRTMLEQMRAEMAQERQTQATAQQNLIDLMGTLSAGKAYGTLVVTTDRPVNYVALAGGSLKEPIQFAHPDTSAGVDFGELLPGVYTLYAHADNWGLEQKVAIRSGVNRREEIPVPEPVETTTLELITNLPDGHRETICCEINYDLDTSADKKWGLRPRNAYLIPHGHKVRVEQVLRSPCELLFRFNIGRKGYSDGLAGGSVRSADTNTWPSAAEDCKELRIPVSLDTFNQPVNVNFPDEWLAVMKSKIAKESLDEAPAAASTVRE